MTSNFAKISIGDESPISRLDGGDDCWSKLTRFVGLSKAMTLEAGFHPAPMRTA